MDNEPITFATMCGTQSSFFQDIDEERLALVVKSLLGAAIKGRTGKVFFTLEEMHMAEALELKERGWTVESVNSTNTPVQLWDSTLPGKGWAQTGWLVNLPI